VFNVETSTERDFRRAISHWLLLSACSQKPIGRFGYAK